MIEIGYPLRSLKLAATALLCLTLFLVGGCKALFDDWREAGGYDVSNKTALVLEQDGEAKPGSGLRFCDSI
jgi:hypothetical protein